MIPAALQHIENISKRLKKLEVIINAIVILIVIGLDIFPLFAADPFFIQLEKRLIEDGVDAHLVHAIYRHPAVKLELDIITGNLKRSEKDLKYEQFLSDSKIAKGREYMKQHYLTLENAYLRFGVPSSIIVAILMVETQLGTYTGKYLTINVLSTMAVANDSQVQKEIFRSLDNENTSTEFRKEMIKRLKKRVLRGYQELKAYLDYLKKSGKDPFLLKGSREGAIGIPQFLPSNISRYGQDGNGDGIVDLFDHDDAIFSVAAFLQANHWKQARTDSEKKDVLLRYNPSIYYVNTVCSLADKLDRLGSKPELKTENQSGKKVITY